MRNARGLATGLLLSGIVLGCGSSAADGDADAGSSLAQDGAASPADGAGPAGSSDGGTAPGKSGQGGNGGTGGEGGTSVDGGSTSLDGGGSSATRTVDKRPYKVVVPSGYVPGTATPVLLLLHGYGETAADIDLYFGTTALAQKETFILVLPNGTTDNSGYQYWNADDACCDVYNKKPDDSGYLHDVIADVKSAFNVDPKRVYIAGHSNGAFMSHRMACDHADEVAAIASLAGMVWKDATQCNPSAPVSVLQVQGDADQVVFYDGGDNTGGGAYPSSPQTVATWAAKNGCDAALTDTGMTLDLDSSLAGAETKVSRHACTNGAAELWRIQGATHFPAFQATWGETFYAFLAAHPKS